MAFRVSLKLTKQTVAPQHRDSSKQLAKELLFVLSNNESAFQPSQAKYCTLCLPPIRVKTLTNQAAACALLERALPKFTVAIHDPVVSSISSSVMASAAVFVYLEKFFSKENLKVPIDLETIEIDPDAARQYIDAIWFAATASPAALQLAVS